MPRKEQVTRVIDGDTFLTNRRTKPVRLANVDAPEKNEKGGSKATTQLKSLILNKEVTVDTVARDKYSRSIANVKIGRISVNKQMNDKLK